jgi:hypothetical protein
MIKSLLDFAYVLSILKRERDVHNELVAECSNALERIVENVYIHVSKSKEQLYSSPILD